jgi:uridylate kinase
MLKNNFKIISLGGSIIIPKTGFNISFLKKFKTLILNEIKRGQKFVLVVGGGATCRMYQAALQEVRKTTSVDLDWLGIYSTYFNAEFVRMMFEKKSHFEVVKNPTIKVVTKSPLIIAAGWKPGCSTDADAVLFAKHYGAKEIINLSNIDYVYDSDPKINKNAKKLENITWSELRKIIGEKWNPGANLPFDPLATRTAQKLGLQVKFVCGSNLNEVRNVIRGKKHVGTLISE